MKHVFKLFAAVVFTSLVSVGFAQAPSPDQVGLYSGTGSITMNDNLDAAKPAKQNATILMLVQADGTVQMQVVLEGGSDVVGMGDGFFGSAAVIYRVELGAVVAGGRLNFKGTGAKLKAGGSINLILPGFLTLGEGTIKLKKIPMI